MIREFRMSDVEQVMKLWLAGNKDAHSFVPEDYWHFHYSEVQEALLEAEVFVYDTGEKIQERINISWSGRNKFELKVHA